MENNTSAYKNYKPQVETYTVPKVIGIKQAAAEFGISEYAIRRWIKSGQLPVITCGKRFLVNCTVLSKFLENGSRFQADKPKPVAIDDKGQIYSALDMTAQRKHSGKIRPIY